MAVLPEDLLAPIGELELAMFPGVEQADIDNRLQAYIDDGVARSAELDPAQRDDATTAWAYYRAYNARAIQLASQPTSIAIPSEISTTRTDAQRSFFESKAAEWSGAFDAMFPIIDDSGDSFPGTGSTPNRYQWGTFLRGNS